MKAIKEWRGMRYDVPSALEVANGVECLGVGTAAGGHEGGREDGSEDGVPAEPRLKFSLAQAANMDETPVWFEAAGKSTVAQIGQKEIGVKPGDKEKTRITAVLTVLADGSKLLPLLIFKGQPSSSNKSLSANGIEREFKNNKDKIGYAYPRGVVYAVDPKAWHSQRVFDKVWMPQVWRQRRGRLGREHGYRQPDMLLAWDDYTVHKTAASAEAMAESNTTLFLVPGGLTPKLQPCDGLVNKLFKAHMSRLYDDDMASPEVGRDKNGYPEAPSRGLLAQWVKKSRDALSADDIRASWKKAGLLLPFDGSEDAAWANKELGADAQGKPLDADDSAAAAGADQSEPTSNAANLMEVLEIADDDDTGVEVLEISDTEEDV